MRVTEAPGEDIEPVMDDRDQGNETDELLAQTPDHPDPGHLLPIERNVFQAFSVPCKVSDFFQKMALHDRVKQHCGVYQQWLENEQLLYPTEVEDSARCVHFTGTIIIWGLGYFKLCVASATGHGSLLLLGILDLLVIRILPAICKPPRLSHRGQAYLDRLQQAFERLKEGTISPATCEAERDPTLLLLGLFGFGVLVGTPYAYFERMFQKAASSGGGCGGGCGDGCGDGCGGCG